MIQFTVGDILDARTEALVNSVNCVGIMGRGIALQFKQAFPDNFKYYEAACKRDEVKPGKMLIFDRQELTWPRYIINFPTKRHWRGKSRLEDVESGLRALVSDLKRLRIKSIAIPPLGSGLGGLEWRDVRPLILTALSEVPEIEVLVFEPSSVITDHRPNRSTEITKMTPGRASVVALMQRYLSGFMAPSISLLEIHKLMYFLQEAGEPLRLKYVKAAYGPYSENLRHVLREMEGHLISGYRNDGDKPSQQITMVPGADDESERFLSAHDDTQTRLSAVAALVKGFESPFGLELLSTVHWVLNEQRSQNSGELVNAVYDWDSRKKKFSISQIEIAKTRLVNEGWVKNN